MPETTIDQLKPLKRNPNKGSKRAHDLLHTSFEQAGAGRSILLANNGDVLAGNHALETYGQVMGNPNVVIVESDGTKLIAVKRTDIPNADDKRAQTLIIADNKTSDHHEYDVDILQSYDADIVGDYWFEEELAALEGYESPVVTEDEPPDLSLADQYQQKWQVERGQLWQVGKHRILCGDSTDKGDVERLMGLAKGKLFATDPPYGVDYVKTKNGIPRPGYSTLSADYQNIEADHFTNEKLQSFLESVFGLWAGYLDHAGWYLWHAHLTQGYFAAAAAADVVIHRQIIWVKSGFNLTRSGMYHWAHEPCFFGWVKGKQCAWYGEKNQRSVWEIDRHQGKGSHPTEKPPELWDAPIKNHTRPGEICLEPFAGSGSQFVACETHGRVCFGMELHPPYVSVCLERLSKLGLTPELVG